MSNVLAFSRKEPHQVGKAFCSACDHHWEATAPVGVVWLECPSCHSKKGLFNFACAPEEDVRTCACENQLFYLTARGHFCPNCGTYQRYD